jgi:aminoglycoside phosphotransferase (APT) family kinase protein
VLDVRRLIDSQFPEWSNLPITPVEPQGWDNRSFRLGEELVVRLPTDERYAAQVEGAALAADTGPAAPAADPHAGRRGQTRRRLTAPVVGVPVD